MNRFFIALSFAILLSPVSLGYMSDESLMQQLFAVRTKDQPKVLKSLLQRGLIPRSTYDSTLSNLESNRQFLIYRQPKVEAELLASAKAVSPHPSLPLDRNVRRAARTIAQTTFPDDLADNIAGIVNKYSISPPIREAWRKVMNDHHEDHLLYLDGKLRDLDAASRRVDERLAEIKKQQAQLRALPENTSDQLRALELLNQLRASRQRSNEPVRTSIPQLRAVTITPAGGGSFYASDPNVPNSITYFQKIGNTYYYSE